MNHSSVVWLRKTRKCPNLFLLLGVVGSFLLGRIAGPHVHRPSSKPGRASLRGTLAISTPVSYEGLKQNQIPLTSRLRNLPVPPSRILLTKLFQGEASYHEALVATGLTQVKPPLEPGIHGDAFYTLQPFQILSWYPRTVLFPKFTDQRTRHTFMDLARTRMENSTVVLRVGQTRASTANIRTSSGAFIQSQDDAAGLLADVESRIAKQCMLPASHGEAFNVLRYKPGQKYDSHMDVFRALWPPSKKLQPGGSHGALSTQRAATTLLYLTTPEEGGHTIFKLEGRDPQGVREYVKCDVGLKYKPRVGDALMFWSMHPNKTIDPHALHGGCPVTKGQKWVATKWVHDQPYK